MKGKLFKIGVSGIVELAVRKIEASKETWAERTINGFRGDWAEWMSMVEPALKKKISELPAKTGDIETNVKNRVVPIAKLMSEESARYRMSKLGPIPPVPAPAYARAYTR